MMDMRMTPINQVREEIIGDALQTVPEQNDALGVGLEDELEEPLALRWEAAPAFCGEEAVGRQHLDARDDHVKRGGRIGELALEPRPLRGAQKVSAQGLVVIAVVSASTGVSAEPLD